METQIGPHLVLDISQSSKHGNTDGPCYSRFTVCSLNLFAYSWFLHYTGLLNFNPNYPFTVSPRYSRDATPRITRAACITFQMVFWVFYVRYAIVQ